MGRADSSQSGRGMHSSLLEEAIWLKRTHRAISSARNRGLGGGDLIWIWNEAPSVEERERRRAKLRGGRLLSLPRPGAGPASLSLSLSLSLPLSQLGSIHP